jgi:hypothetical protein
MDPGRIRAYWNDRFWQILLKKSFLAHDQKFSGPLVRLTRCDVRDHIN